MVTPSLASEASRRHLLGSSFRSVPVHTPRAWELVSLCRPVPMAFQAPPRPTRTDLRFQTSFEHFVWTTILGLFGRCKGGFLGREGEFSRGPLPSAAVGGCHCRETRAYAHPASSSSRRTRSQPYEACQDLRRLEVYIWRDKTSVYSLARGLRTTMEPGPPVFVRPHWPWLGVPVPPSTESPYHPHPHLTPPVPSFSGVIANFLCPQTPESGRSVLDARVHVPDEAISTRVCWLKHPLTLCHLPPQIIPSARSTTKIRQTTHRRRGGQSRKHHPAAGFWRGLHLLGPGPC